MGRNMNNDYTADPYISHSTLNIVLAARRDTGWQLREVLPCQPRGEEAFVTLLWQKTFRGPGAIPAPVGEG